MKVAVIIPAYNEQLTLAQVMRQFHAQLPDAEIWVVNNASTDDTAGEAKRTFAETKMNGGLLYEPKKGKSNACRKAFREIDADVYVMVDADLTYPANLVHRLIDPVAAGEADTVIADCLTNQSYQDGQTRRFHTFGNFLVCRLLSMFFGTTISDAMSGYRSMSNEFIKLYPMLQSGFEMETEMTIHAVYYGYNILQIPCDYRDRPAGSFSKLNTLGDGFRVLKLIVRLLKNNRPVQFFGAMAVLFGLAGVIVGLPVTIEFMRTGLVRRIPSAILASGLCTSAFFIALIGIVMDTITCFQRFDYQIRRNLWPRTRKLYALEAPATQETAQKTATLAGSIKYGEADANSGNTTPC
jgi:glycosyltransferase involved in cell wall biosynthesis